jgi:hypothetical protein
MFGKIKIITKDEFYKELVTRLTKRHEYASIQELIEEFLREGFEKFSIDNLNKILPKYFIFWETTIIDFGNPDFYWIVCGFDAIIIHKKYVDIEADSPKIKS